MKDKKTMSMDYASLYPTAMRDFFDDRFKLKKRRKKLDKILNNINESII